MTRRFSIHAVSLLMLVGCVSEGPPSPAPITPTPAPFGAPHGSLDAWHLFTDARAQKPAEGVLPYDVIAPLFADYALKRRFLWVPPGEKIGWNDTERWELPVGSVFIKTFSYPVDARDASKGERLLETRLLVHEDMGWVGHTYVWDAAQQAAVRKVVGDTINATWIDEDGAVQTNAYTVPNTNVCQECHGTNGKTAPLGNRARQWSREHDYGKGPEDQIDHLAALGLLDAAPLPVAMRQKLVDPSGNGDATERGRAYLDANCSHCHGVVGLAKGTAFWLDYDHTDPIKGNPTDWGVCKVPASAGGGTCGLGFDVVPGHADQSIVPCRVGSTEAKVAMPPVGHNLIDVEGVAVLKAWIDAMPPKLCQ